MPKVAQPVWFDLGFLARQPLQFQFFSLPKTPPAEANIVAGGVETVKLGMFLPHEIFASLYSFRGAQLFHSLLRGTPNAPCRNQSWSLVSTSFVSNSFERSGL